MNFLMACKEEPLLSFKSLMALLTIADVGGWLGLDCFELVADFFCVFPLVGVEEEVC